METPKQLRSEIRSLQNDLGWSNGDLATFLLQHPRLTLWAYATEEQAQEVIGALQSQKDSQHHEP